MSGPPQLDGRRARALEAELLRRARTVLSGDGRDPEPGPLRAIFGVAARIGEEVTRRLDQAPAKQEDNFYTAAGIGRDPARPASVPVALKLVDGAREVLTAPPQLQLMADSGGPVFFETGTRIDLAPGTIAALRGIDATADSITIPSASVMAAALPRTEPTLRRLRSGAAAGATKVQIDPAAGLEPGMLLRIGEGELARHYEAVAVEGDLVTLEPPLETGLAEGAPAVEVGEFAPFATVTRNHQSHALYLGHASLLDIPSAVTITISGAPLPAEATWSWWGQLGDDDPPAWQSLGSGKSKFTKLPGKLVKKKIGAHESLWLRAELPGKSTGSSRVQDLRIGIGGGGACDKPHEQRCGVSDEMSVGFEAVANNAPAVTNRPFHPFGREPRLYDSFYIGSDEAFSKVGAEVSLCFNLSGSELGPIAAIKGADATRFFAVGADGLLYRGQTPTLTGGTLSPAELRPVPPPGAGSAILFQDKSPIAIWKVGSVTSVAVAGAVAGALHVANLTDGDDLDKVQWIRLPFAATAPVEALAVHSGTTVPFLYARVGTEIYQWPTVSNGVSGTLRGAPVRDLVQVEPSDPLTGVGAVLIVEKAGLNLIAVREGTAPKTWPAVPAAQLPETRPSAFVDALAANILFVAGYDNNGDLQLAELDATASSVASTPIPAVSLAKPLPVAFSPGRAIALGSGLKRRPMLAIATTNPTYVTWYKSGSSALSPTVSFDPTSIGISANKARGLVRSADFTAVQRPDIGLYFRASPGGGIADDIRVPASEGFLADSTQIPATAARIVHFNGNPGEPFDAFAVTAPAASGKTILKLKSSTAPSPTGDIVAYDMPLSLAGTENTSTAAMMDLPNPITDLLTTMVAVIQPGPTEQIWNFPTRTGGTSLWPNPGVAAGSGRGFNALSEIGRDGDWVEAALLPLSSSLELALSSGLGAWPAENSAFQSVELLKYATGAAVAYPHNFIFNFNAHFLAAPAAWQEAGPDRDASPTLSWEYWNGESWWALATLGTGPELLVDGTANLTQSGGVFFKVPPDIQPTEVGGRPSHWVRVRFVGGSFGEAKVTVTSTTSGTSPVVTEQVVTRDLGSIRAPYVTSLRLGYCAEELVRPEIVLTEDSLGSIDQTSANEAGLVFPVFTPVGELMNPVNAAETAAAAQAEAERCDISCPPPPAAPGAECDAPGAYDSCDSPCIAPDGRRAPAGGEAAGFVRGLMLGFERGFDGDNVSLYVDAEPSGLPTRLAADMLRNGRFVPIAVIEDTSYGLTEPGILTLAIPAPPDRSDLLGSPAHWVRLRPKTDSANWSPRLRGIHLNAVLARSVETRVMERLGTSNGLAGQVFRLSEAPIDYGSLKLRVREALAEEDDPEGRLDVQEYPGGLPGKWVRWTVANDLIEGDSPERAFILDAEQGVIRFGDGKAGRIPPLGADILAETYARVIGDRANGVPPGEKFQLLSPLAGVDSAIALDHAAGGSDAESLESARRRAPAKIRHGRHILTRADLEDHALTLSPRIAQVRAQRRGGVCRLVVVLKGADPWPTPAALRGFASAIREVAGYGLARPGGLDVVPPRLLPIAIELVLQPRSPDLFAEAAVQAKNRLVALFDPATGNHDGKGWPLGRLPDAQDVAAALVPIDALAQPVRVTLERADKETAAARELPKTLPLDVLARLDPADVVLERPREMAL